MLMEGTCTLTYDTSNIKVGIVPLADHLVNPPHTNPDHLFFLHLSTPGPRQMGCFPCLYFSPTVHNHTVFYWPNFTFARSEATVPSRRSHSSHARIRRRTSSFGDRGAHPRAPRRNRYRHIKSHSIAALITTGELKPETGISPIHIGRTAEQHKPSSCVRFAGQLDQTSEASIAPLDH